MLIESYPESVGIVNNAGGTPLHLACCVANASSVIVEAIIQKQMDLGITFNIFDNNGKKHLVFS